MAETRIEHTFDCSCDTFWNKVFFNLDFNRKMHLEHLHFHKWELVETRETDSSIVRTVQVVPAIGEVPAAIKALIGEGLGYREEGCYDKKTQRYRLSVVPTALADKISINGEIWAEPIAPVRCKRIFLAQIAVRVFGIGSIIEQRIIADLRLNYNAGAAYTAAYLREHGLAGT
jgi:hypothetical protein